MGIFLVTMLLFVAISAVAYFLRSLVENVLFRDGSEEQMARLLSPLHHCTNISLRSRGWIRHDALLFLPLLDRVRPIPSEKAIN
jgi:hypothetical protein